MRPIPEFPGYFADEEGHIWSERADRWGNAPLRRLRSHWDMRYPSVSLARGDGTYPTVGVHILVCSAFHGPRPAGMVCRHLDGDSHNNRPGNLAWGTHADNRMDYIKRVWQAGRDGIPLEEL